MRFSRYARLTYGVNKSMGPSGLGTMHRVSMVDGPWPSPSRGLQLVN